MLTAFLALLNYYFYFDICIDQTVASMVILSFHKMMNYIIE